MRAHKRFACCTAMVALAAMQVPAHADLVISKKPTSNMTCIAGVCSATAADAVLSIKDLKSQLDIGDVKVVSGSIAGDIVFDAKFKWVKPTRLTLDSYHSIVFKLAVVAEGHRRGHAYHQ